MPEPTSGCFLWIAYINKDGYGEIRGSNWGRPAHRVAYEVEYGPVPDDLTIDHLCRNRACVNPRHLEAVTRGENVLRGVGPSAANARKTHCKRGHEFNDETTLLLRGGGRACLPCKRAREKAGYYRRRRSA